MEVATETNAVLIGGYGRHTHKYITKLKELGVNVTASVENDRRKTIKKVPTGKADVILLMADISGTTLRRLAEDASRRSDLPLIFVSKNMTITKKALVKAGLVAEASRGRRRYWTDERIAKVVKYRECGKTFDQVAKKLPSDFNGRPITAKATATAYSRWRAAKEKEDLLAKEAAGVRTQEDDRAVARALRDAKDYIKALEEELEKRKGEVEEMSAGRKDFQEDHAKERDRLMKQVSVANEHAQIMRSSRDQLAGASGKAELELKEVRVELELCRSQLVAAKTVNETVTGLYDAVREKLEALQSTAAAQRSVAAVVDPQLVQGLRDAVATHLATISSLRADVTARADSCRGLMVEKERLETSISESEHELRSEVEGLKCELKKARSSAVPAPAPAPASDDGYQRGLKDGLKKGLKIGSKNDPDVMEVLALLGVA